MHSDKQWAKIKKDYLKGASMQSLHRKYGVSVSAISCRAKKEGWTSLSKQIQDKTEQKVIEKMSDTLSDDITNIEKTYLDSVKLAISIIATGLQACDPGDSSSIKGYVTALKNIKEIGVINVEESANEFNVVLEEELEEYAQ